MKLLIDVGNTLTKFCYDSSFDEVCDILTKNITQKSFEDCFKLSDIEEVYVSSVVPSVSKIIKDFFYQYKIKTYFVVSTNQNFVNIKLDNPDELGSDLVCDLIGASTLVEEPTIIVDLGTASKILYLSKDKDFSYCAIIPGLESMISILDNSTALLENYKLSQPIKLTECKHTPEVVVSSVIYSHADSINGLVSRFENELGFKCKKIITGGYESDLKSYFNFQYINVNYLALRGLLEISRKGIK